ncbi:magnesium transporter CorA family protein [Paracoccus zhejiangensis]|uniref:Magnesium transporter n=1 Tax=Paracoccus zhejiangensis TaxID=1077935 RepID=A0A2H5EU02_9RHOB|nr:magnesium transporter CorA family protein [Paracoccus zhejiangensis]AUH62770.1 magnesium transporter [Paracoccus zhejiangensis]
MIRAYTLAGNKLVPLPEGVDLAEAIWIDLWSPTDKQIADATALGIDVPSLADMEEIEISNRLYREGDTEYMTAVLPGELPDGTRVAMPVAFLLSPGRLVTVRHHAPRPFNTFPDRAERSTTGCRSAERLFLGLIEEIIARLADILENSGRVLDATVLKVFDAGADSPSAVLQAALSKVGAEAELMARVRLGLLTIERLLAFYTATTDERPDTAKIRAVLRGQQRDVQALEVHADFLSSRVSLSVDTTLGMINLQQNKTVRILSVIAALFLPPTLIASIYGMNFEVMPELQQRWGYGMALVMMVGSAVGTYLVLRWKKWL